MSALEIYIRFQPFLQKGGHLTGDLTRNDGVLLEISLLPLCVKGGLDTPAAP